LIASLKIKMEKWKPEGNRKPESGKGNAHKIII
jgi:hypothetical protein